MSGKTELRLFDEPLPQLVVESASFVDISPTTSILDESSKIDFVIYGSEREYLDLNDTFLYVRYSVRAADGKTSLPTDSKVTPVRYMMNALFSDVTLSLNDTIIEGGNQLYSYKSTIETIFGFNREAKEVKFAAIGYAEAEDDRKKWIAQSRLAELAGPLRLDFLNQPKYLLPNVNVRITLTRSRADFSLTGGGTTASKLLIHDVKLYVRRVRVAKPVMLAHEKGLVTRNAIYPHQRGKVVSYSIPSGSLSHFRDNVFSTALLPKLVIVGFVKAHSFNGDSLDGDPFFFEHFNVQSIGLYRDGQAVPYREIYQPSFSKKLVVKSYVKSIIHNTQLMNTNQNNGITLTDFMENGYTFFTFNLTADFDYNQQQMAHDGNLRLDIKFEKALGEPINVIVYGLFDTQIAITKERQIITSNV
jgi:hypothetical protein